MLTILGKYITQYTETETLFSNKKQNKHTFGYTALIFILESKHRKQ